MNGATIATVTGTHSFMKHFYDQLTATKDRPTGFRITVTVLFLSAAGTLLLTLAKTMS